MPRGESVFTRGIALLRAVAARAARGKSSSCGYDNRDARRKRLNP
jgi:hypothetical protein